eukprot:CAMPEP_0180820044 /NCGR_PEP_ID=MMETSP1038_2-20121128/70069_1 /TAXON_ID=632150 /ORGANISM="Azadinium spinosum, Strain 3D9" /LENGTH=145 /DNA_ID=CAMNT_0022862097 /DNA_START=70 /DNA_END=507 /DNA_ORIENTATION=+
MLTVSPSASTRTFCVTTSSSRNEGQPCTLLSSTKSLKERPRGAMKSGFPVTGSLNVILPDDESSDSKAGRNSSQYPDLSANFLLKQQIFSAVAQSTPQRRGCIGGLGEVPCSFGLMIESSPLIEAKNFVPLEAKGTHSPDAGAKL